ELHQERESERRERLFIERLASLVVGNGEPDVIEHRHLLVFGGGLLPAAPSLLRPADCRMRQQHEARPNGRASLFRRYSSTARARRDRADPGSPAAAATASEPAGLGRRGTARRRSSG